MERFRAGIDLGTTNTLVCYMKDGKPKLLKFPPTGDMLPSVLYMDEDGTVLVGDKARKKGKRDPQNLIRSSKTEMGNFEKRWSLRGRSFTPTDVAAEILREVKRAILKKTRSDGDLEIEVVITVPAYFTSNQIDETKKAGERAGLKVLGIITEPRAAAIANIKEVGIENQKILVADLGGGTFDVSLLEAGGTEYRTLAVDGDRKLGGDDFDAKLAQYIQAFVEDDLGMDLSSQQLSGLDYNTYHTVMADIRDGACEAKLELSEEEEYELILPNLFPYKGGQYTLTLTITRQKFEELCADLFQKIRDRIHKVFADNSSIIRPEDVQNVILAGGSCYIPKIKSDVEQIMGRTADTTMDRSTMVAIGACFVADTWDDPNGDVKDIISHSLGIQVWDGGRDRLAKLLMRGDAYPCSAKQVFTTIMDNQDRVSITIYEAGSDLEDVEDIMKEGPNGGQVPIHDLYGSFELTGIQKAPKGVPQIEVSFEYDRSRLLTVTAEDLVTGAKKQVQVTKGMLTAPPGHAEPMDFELLLDISGSMSGQPLQQAKDAAKKLAREILDLTTQQLGIICFDNPAWELCPLSSDKELLRKAINRLIASGSTDMAGAIKMGIEALSKSKRRRAILIVTDGQPDDRGLTSREAQNAKSKGIEIITIAAGSEAEKDYLSTLASERRFAYSIKTMDELAEKFRTAVSDLARK